MKKSMLALAVLVIPLSVGVIGCGSEKDSEIGDTLKSGELEVTLESICWVDIYTENNFSWDTWELKLVATFTVENSGKYERGFSHDDVYLITEDGKVYDNSITIWGIDVPIGGEDFKPREKRPVTYGWYFTQWLTETRADVEELRELDGVQVVVDKAEFELPKLITLDLLTTQQYRDLYGEDPPPLAG